MVLSTRGPSLGSLVWESGVVHADRLALWVDEQDIRYGELALAARRWARALADASPRLPRLGAVFAMRSRVAYQAVIATLFSGAGYVPLNPKFPASRNGHMLKVSDASTLIVGAECLGGLDGVLQHVQNPLVILLPTVDEPADWAAKHPRHKFLGKRALEASAPIDAPVAVDPGEIAYLLFTSGSTGAPKGVMVSHGNVLSFLGAMWERYGISANDRFSQTFDLTFDLSAFDLFTCWGRGASLHVPPPRALALPDEFIRARELTVWFSVPSVGMMLRDTKRLVPNAFPSLKWSLFCGERLPGDVASAWQLAAPGSVVENLYGPTEATIACTLHRWRSESDAVDGVVAIGRPYPAMTAAIVDEQLAPCPSGVRGELCVKGPQVSLGYWKDAAKTAERFVQMPWHAGPANRWYRTGDVAYVNAAGDLVHCGRNDDQIKLRGFRIELAEVEHAIRDAAATSFVVVLPFPRTADGPIGLTAVVAGTSRTEDEILDQARLRLPDYMLPGQVVSVPELPLNANGKIDRKALLSRLEEGSIG
jgi:amino acid adenylation domain-containing protein